MTLFAILGIPLFTLFLVSLYSVRRKKEHSTASIFKGMLYCIPALILIHFLKTVLPLSFRPFRLYLYYTIQDHLLPFLFVMVWCFLFFRQKNKPELIFFISGFYSLLTIIEVIMDYGQYDLYRLFILPVIRMSILIYFPLLFIRYREWYGFYKIFFLAFMMLIPLVGGVISYSYMSFYTQPAVVSVALLFIGSLVFFLVGKEY